MFTNNFLKFTLFVSVLLTLNVLQQAESSMLNSRYGDNFYQYPIVYQRFIRRRPPTHPHDMYMEQVVEIFHTKEKPPSPTMTDEEIDKFIFCDFHRHLDECKKYWESRKRPTVRRTTTTTTSTTKKPLIVTTTTLKSTTTTREPEPTTEFSAIPALTNNDYEYTDEDLDAEEENEYNNYEEDNENVE